MLKTVVRPHRSSLQAASTQEQKIFAMLKLIPASEIAQTRPSLAFTLAVDTSASMQAYADQGAAEKIAGEHGIKGQRTSADGGKYESFSLNLPTLLDQAIEAAHTLVDDPRLEPGDLISIVQFDDEARILLPLTAVAQRAAAHQAIEGLREFAGGTRMARGLYSALQEMNRLPATVARRVLVLTDGATFDEDECLGWMPHYAAGNTPLIAIGFGDEYNDKLMARMADATGGRAYHLRAMTELSQVLQVEIGSSLREVVTDLKMGIATIKGVRVDSITRVYPSLSEVAATERPIRLGNIAAGDYTTFILEFTVDGTPREPSRVRLAQIGLEAYAPALGREERFPLHDLIIDFTHDAAAIAAVDPEVIGYVQQKNVGRLVDEAVRQATIDAGAAQRALQVAAGMTQRLGNAGATLLLSEAMSELAATGSLSAGTEKTVALGLRTKTIKTATVDKDATGGLSPEDIRRLSGV